MRRLIVMCGGRRWERRYLGASSLSDGENEKISRGGGVGTRCERLPGAGVGCLNSEFDPKFNFEIFEK